MKLLKVILVLVSTWLSFTATAGDAVAGKEKAQVCKACHGANGIAIIPGFPNLAGQNEKYLIDSMKAYRDGDRLGTSAQIMRAQSTGLSDTDIEDLAAYYTQLK